MEAQIRIATRKESPGFIRPYVCVIGDHVHYTFRVWKFEVAIPSLNLVFTPTRGVNELVYELPGDEKLCVTSGQGYWAFDGDQAREHWPTRYRRELHCGPRVFRIKPEDDTLWIDFTTEVPDPKTTIIGFFLNLGNSDG